jgi:pimeloyl-ACP methyl ester carboxylesterase
MLVPGASFGRLAESAGAREERIGAQDNSAAAKNIELVHGAFTDGTSWGWVIPLLEAKGFTVTAVQNPLTSLAEDAATTRKLLAQQKGPTILVGHSYAGFVITEAGNAPNVMGFVYVSSERVGAIEPRLAGLILQKWPN